MMSRRSFVCAGLLSVGLLASVCVGQNKMAIYPSPHDDIGRLTEELREAGDQKKKGDITKQLESAVGDAFDMDLKVREAELSKLETRLKRLHEQLDRRRQARGEIIQLEVKVLTNEAAGLGFSSEGRKGDFGIQFRGFARDHFRKPSALPETTISR
jgi:hypothetical protein